MGKRRKPREIRERGLGGALALTVASAVLPGLAHLRGGRRTAGAMLLTIFLALAAVAAYAGTHLSRDEAVKLALQEKVLVAAMAGAIVLAVMWCSIVISSYRAVRPRYLSPAGGLTGGAAVTVLCLAIVAPLAFAGHRAYIQHDLIRSVFSNGSGLGGSAEDFWASKPRINILLAGGDLAENRSGVRTDSMIVASIDTRTGDTVLLGLPRNLQKARMPEGPARERFPDGFTGDGAPGNELLNAVWKYGEDHRDVVPDSDQPGPDLLKGTIGAILGQQVDYYVLVNLFGFREIVNAFGGVKIRITEPIPYGRENEKRIVNPEKVLRPGLRKLDGSESLWYVRSRSISSDYSRMNRQRCMLGAIARQASPQVVFTRFQKIATATKKVISTDLPADLLPHLVTLASKAKSAKISSVTFSPPLITPADPDFGKIKRTTAKAIAEASKAKPKSDRLVTASASGSRKPSARAGSNESDESGDDEEQSTEGASGAKKRAKPALSVEQACQYS